MNDLNKQVDFIVEKLNSPYHTLREFEKHHAKKRQSIKYLIIKHKSLNQDSKLAHSKLNGQKPPKKGIDKKSKQKT